MLYCRNCGNQLKEGSLFCDKCGTKVIEIEQPISQATSRTNSKLGRLFQGVKKAVEVSTPHLKRAGKFIAERAQIAAENLEKDGKEGKGLFAPIDWQPPNIDPLEIELPKGLTIDSFDDMDIFGTKTKPKKRPYIRKALRVLIYKRDRGICKICGKKVDWHDYNIAHDVAHSKGGKISKSNLFIAHPLCNRSMGTERLNEMQKIMGN